MQILLYWYLLKMITQIESLINHYNFHGSDSFSNTLYSTIIVMNITTMDMPLLSSRALLSVA